MSNAVSPLSMPEARSTVPARRMLALWLPYLSTDRLHRIARGRGWRCVPPAEPQPPLAVTAKIKSAQRLVALDEQALGLGLTRGQALAEARAMIPSLVAVEADSSADARLLAEVADWADRYTPLVALDGDGLMLDITGCAHLFGGEAALVSDLSGRLLRQGILGRVAIADTPGAASAAARFRGPPVVAPGGQEALLAGMPMAALRLPEETVAALTRVGLKTVGQVLRAPRAPLAARFGAFLIRRIDQALGAEEEAVTPRRPLPALIAERRLAEPIGLLDDIRAGLLSLAGTLARALEERGAGGRLFEFSLFRVDGVVSRATVGTSRPARAPRLVADLFEEKFAALGGEIDAGYGFDMMRLSVLAADRNDPAAIDFSGDAEAEADLSRLIDRIGARLGLSRVGRIEPRDSHLPELAAALVRPGSGGGSDGWNALDLARPEAGAAEEPVERPLRLFARPEPVAAIAEVPDGPPLSFRWRRALYEVVRAEGPERIAPEWWRGEGFTRDYFRIEDRDGRRFWVFREGLYERETAAPRWFLHGVFG